MKKLAIIGASYLQLPLIRRCKQYDIETHCFAWEKGAVCKEYSDFFYPVSITEKERILELCRKNNIHGITSISSDLAVPTMRFVGENLSLVSDAYEDAEACTDKYLMRKEFTKQGIPSPRFQEIRSGSNEVELPFPLIVKPVDRSGSRGISRVSNKSQLNAALKKAFEVSFKKRAIVEEYIEGDEISVETISWDGTHHILAYTDKVTTGPPHFVELEHHQPSKVNDRLKERINLLTKKCLDSLNINYGASHTELKINPDGKLTVIEVGARMGGDFIGSHLVELSTGYDFLKGVIDVSLGQFQKPEKSFIKASGVYFLSKNREMVEETIKNAKAYPFIKESKLFNGKLSNLTESSDRNGYLIYQSDSKISLGDKFIK